jgi:CubicO group peptidase (beta-lactamase class C family)
MKDLYLMQPESAGFSTGRLERLNTLFQSYIQNDKLAGISATVARQGKTVYLNKFGWMDKEAQKLMEYEAIFRIASMSKPVTSVAAMMLYEKGLFQLNTPVREFIPAFKDFKVAKSWGTNGPELEDLHHDVTMRNLFTHTSGLTYGFDPNDPIDHMIQEKGKEMEASGHEPDMGEIVAELVRLPLAFQPGTKWRYGYNIEVLGHIVEIISGKSLGEYMQENIFGPLGMVDTGFYVPPEKAGRVPAVYGHPKGPDQLEKLDIGFRTQMPRAQSGGGGLVSTLPDYARFCQMLVNAGELGGVRLLSPTTVALYSINHCPEQALPYGFSSYDLYHAGYGYSLATRVLMDVSKTGMYGSAGEFGWDGAFSTYFWVDPVQSLYGLMMLQHSPNAYYPIAQQFKAVTYQAMI